MKKFIYRNTSLLFVTIMTLGIFASIPVYGCACGMLVPDNVKDIAMKEERGVVIYDSKTRIEQMAIDFQLEGSSSKTALVVPTPVKAEIGQIKKEVIDEIDYLINPPKLSMRPDTIGATSGSAKDVQVLERKTVGVFDIAALKANTYQDLFAWTQENGFYLQEAAESPVRSYIDNDFILNVIKIKKNSKTSDINPLLFSFETSSLFYPLMEVKDSRNDLKDKSLSLYLITDVKTDFSYYSTVTNRGMPRASFVDAITSTTEKDFTNLKFTASTYYATYIHTENYSKNSSLVSTLGNPEITQYAPLGLDYARSKPITLWLVISISALVTIFFIALGVFAYYRGERRRLAANTVK
jgi:hypothetical protein